jgi:hypothetical protein
MPQKSERVIIERMLRAIELLNLGKSLEELESQVRAIRKRRIKNYKYEAKLCCSLLHGQAVKAGKHCGINTKEKRNSRLA